MKKYFALSILSIAALSLSACGTTTSNTPYYSSTPSQKASNTKPTPEELKKQLELAKRAYDEHPDDPARVRGYANILHKNGDAKKAYSTLKKLAGSKDAIHDDFIFMALLAEKQGNENICRTWLRTALNENPTDLNARLKLTSSFEKSTEWDKAEPLYIDALQENLKESYSEENLKKLYDAYSYNLIEQKKHREALDLLMIAKAEFPDAKDVERNVRITRALMQSHGHAAPKPPERPKK
jgi:tetratricopeptide (TPR) repeat protein